MPEPYFELQAVTAYRGRRRVFENLSLRLCTGEHTVILGPNGSGKSSLIKLLSREIYPVVQAGSWLRVFGRSTVNLWALRHRIGLVSPDLHAHYSAGVRGADVVLSGFFGSVGLGRSQQPSGAQRLRVAALMEELGLEDLAERPFGELSDGQRRRLLLARALVHDPEVLVLDEPTNGLDLKARHQLLALLRQLTQRGTTLLLVTHQIEAIVPEIQRCVLLSQGQVVGDGPAAELLQAGPLSALFDTPLQVVSVGGFHQVLPASPHPVSRGGSEG
ncbi:ABC transporter ATP-binding protein [Cyanobium sp. NIES-981]|uniref:ABC transporter ATP-binding protein n=1 Tax=Cyanobium sp. NIES-981 TaxID=1851505 RepID=UPI0007DD0B35|nr:ATP-binding cassette domain-containing protein [Cyanobium sp. NIES-981]SBO42608.1 ATPase [Cyanobium sp. NIES-981]